MIIWKDSLGTNLWYYMHLCTTTAAAAAIQWSGKYNIIQ